MAQSLVRSGLLIFNLSMSNFLSVFIGFRYITSKRREGYVSFVSMLSIIAMALGVTALVTVLSVMNGFDREIKNRILQIVPHATVESSGGLAEWWVEAEAVSKLPNINRVSPYTAGAAMLSHNGYLQGINMHGVLPEHRAMRDSLGKQMIAGSVGSLEAGRYNIVLGQLLAQALDAQVGDKILLTLPEVLVTPGGIFPRVKQLQVSGVFATGAQVDNGLAFVHLDDASKLMRLGEKVSGLRLFMTDPYDLDSLAAVRELVAENRQVSSWHQSMRELFAAIQMEKTVVALMLSVIIGVAAFNIVASLVLMVNEKRTDIAVLRTMGNTAGDISRIFLFQGGLTGAIGVILGVFGGCFLALNIGNLLIWLENELGFRVFDADLYFITRLPSQLQWLDVLLVAGLAMVLSLLATWYPALRAGRVHPAEALRYK
jgi:lipoprotein-releasing system permease protein